MVLGPSGGGDEAGWIHDRWMVEHCIICLFPLLWASVAILLLHVAEFPLGSAWLAGLHDLLQWRQGAVAVQGPSGGATGDYRRLRV